ncbi:MAG: efflux RND transporter periplasmic adaptor subunit [Proteobacteria bacterium]|nr:efflux RND transporter periplasmic adaptor subunit [Pseudomonadota bacterium]
MKKNITIAILGLISAVCLGILFWPHLNHAHDHDHDHDHAEYDDTHADHDDVVRLTDAVLAEFNIEQALAQAGKLDLHVTLTGEISLNEEDIARVHPKIEGMVTEVHAPPGTRVVAGQRLAILNSPGLAEAQAGYSAAIERHKTAQANFQRESALWEKKMTSQQEYLDAQQNLIDAKVEQNLRSTQLLSLGMTKRQLEAFSKQPGTISTRFEVVAPVGGTILERHVTVGENVGTDALLFTIADLDTVWGEFHAFASDLGKIGVGQDVGVYIDTNRPSLQGKVTWIAPLVDPATRTAKVRVVLPNTDGNLRPGAFASANVSIGQTEQGIPVPKTALQTFENQTVIFVRTDDGFIPRPIIISAENDTHVLVASGLDAGQTYVTKGAFTLKAELSKSLFDDGHNH